MCVSSLCFLIVEAISCSLASFAAVFVLLVTCLFNACCFRESSFSPEALLCMPSKTAGHQKQSGLFVKHFMCWCGSTPFGSDVEAPWHQRFPDGRRLTLTTHFLTISAKVGAFSTSRSNLELDKSVEDPQAADACSILLTDYLLSGQFGFSTILHM